MEKTNNIALLIDAENIESKYIEKILGELSSRGRIIVKRAYADWTKSQVKPLKKLGPDSYNLWEVLNGWYQILAAKGIVPMQQSQNTVGKNSSDIYLVIDAMDLMYQGVVDTFCIVSSDGDFTRLCTRLTEAGKNVIVMGETHTPNSVKAASEFINLGYAVEKFGPSDKGKHETRGKAAPTEEKVAKPQEKVAKSAIQTAAKSAAAPKNQPQEKTTEPKARKNENFIPMLIKKASERDDLKPKEETAAATAETQKPAEATAEKPIAAGKSYDEEIISDIKKLIAKHKNQNNEINYQKLLDLLRKAHPECEKIAKGEKNILEIFKNVPGVIYRTESGNYLFSLEELKKDDKAPEEVKSAEKAEEVKKEEAAEETTTAEKPNAKPKRRASKKSVKAKTEEEKPTVIAGTEIEEPAAEKAEKAEESKKPAAKKAKSKKAEKPEEETPSEEKPVKKPRKPRAAKPKKEKEEGDKKEETNKTE